MKGVVLLFMSALFRFATHFGSSYHHHYGPLPQKIWKKSWLWYKLWDTTRSIHASLPRTMWRCDIIFASANNMRQGRVGALISPLFPGALTLSPPLPPKQNIVSKLKDRFKCHKSRKETVRYVARLIGQSRSSYGTSQYDQLQLLSNGILP